MATGSEPHLSSRLVAAYLEGGLSRAERERAESHLASCAACRRELVEVSRLADPGRRMRRLAPVAGIAAAAAIALVAGVATLSVGVSPPDEEIVRASRSESSTALSVVTPAPGATLPADGLRFVWNAASAGSTYRIVLMDDSGRPLWSLQTADTTAHLPPEVELEPAALYFWFVDALAADGSTLTTGARQFSIRR